MAPASPANPAPLVEVAVPVGDADAVSVELWALGATAVAESAAAGADGDAAGRVLLRAGIPDDARAEAAVQVLASRYEARLAHEDPQGAWWDGWRRYAQPTRSGRVVVVPAWLGAQDWTSYPETGPDAAGEGLVRVLLDAGRSFGTGAHPTTRLALAALSEQPLPGCALLDLGSGSGVLAIAAALLGAGPVTAVDSDPDARAATADNARRNEVDIRVAGEVAGSWEFDLVIANLPAGTWESLAPVAVDALRPGGILLATGFLERRWPSLQPRFAACHAQPYAERTREGWGCRLLRRVP